MKSKILNIVGTILICILLPTQTAHAAEGKTLSIDVNAKDNATSMCKITGQSEGKEYKKLVYIDTSSGQPTDVELGNVENVMVTMLYPGAGHEPISTASVSPTWENGHASVSFTVDKTSNIRGYGIWNHFDIKPGPLLEMPETGGIGTGIVIIGGLCFIALGLGLAKKKNKASFLALLIILLVPCQALAAEQTCIQTYPNEYNEEFVETVDSFTKNITVENKGSEPAFAKVWAIPDEGYSIEYLDWTKNEDDTMSPDAPLMPGESATLGIKITNADGTEIKSDDKELSFDVMVFHELESIPDPKAYVQITNDEELTAKVSFEIPETTRELQEKLNVKLTLANDDEEKFTLDLIKDSAPSFPERLLMEEGLTYEWLLDSLMDKADGTPMHFKNMYPEDDIPALGYEFTVSASVALSYNGIELSSATASDTNNSLYQKETESGTTAYVSNVRQLQNLDEDTSATNGHLLAIQTCDIDAGSLKNNKKEILLEKYNFTPIANNTVATFKVEPENQYSIDNLYVNDKGRTGSGLFDVVNNFKFQNVILDNADVNGTTRPSGGLVGYVGWGENGFENCKVQNSKINSDTATAAGMAGQTWSGNITFNSCSLESLTVTANGSYAAGLIAYGGSPSAMIFENCTIPQAGVVISGNFAGGLAGSMDGTSNFLDCEVNEPQITGQQFAGGIAANVSKGTFENCIANKGTYDAPGWVGEAGALVGRATGSSINNCHATEVTVKAVMNAGGLIGSAIDDTDTSSVTNASVDKSIIQSTNYAGGINANAIGGTYENCQSTNNDVSGTGSISEVGGLIGRTRQTEITSCSSYQESLGDSSTVRGTSAGGLVGVMRHGNRISNSFASEHVMGHVYAGGLVGNLENPQVGEDSIVGGTNPVSINTCYADGYVDVGTGDNINGYIQFAAGLVGIKHPNASLDIQDAYATGFLTHLDSRQTRLCGLVGGDWFDANDVKISNTYVAMEHVNGTDKSAISYAYTNQGNVYALERAGLTNVPETVTYDQLSALSPGGAFGTSGDGYPFPVLSNLPRFGPWPER